ncbi:MAG: UDP-N-acetylglucosamine--N-acetylmuramyl-(pentapeptide) pyrophosphoryl-undecaprenol N-acetylglucosamine transferase [Opitutaceae bacterium]
MSKRRFLVSCGGTGGHLSPGIALAEGLIARGHEAVLLISRKRVDGRLIGKYPGLRFERMPGHPFSLRPMALARCAASQALALLFCLRLIARWRPDAIVGFGGFTSAPIVLAGGLARIPVVLHESNRVPGLAIRTAGRFAQRVYLPAGVRIGSVSPWVSRQVGLPVRSEIVRLPRADSRAALGLDPNQKVLAVLGGSQGASVLNEWTRINVGALAAEGIQVYCLTGLDKGPAESIEMRTRTGAAVRVIFAPFCDRMAELLSAADLVVSRAGAGTLAELIRCETPAILVPYPHAADRHQDRNAEFFERQGGGLVVNQAMMGGLLAEVMEAIFNEWLLRKFRANLQRMDRANPLETILLDLEEIAGSGGGGPAKRLEAA